ncbi:aldehyde dehydrogenase family protein, partial [Pseudomonas aeruginosa]
CTLEAGKSLQDGIDEIREAVDFCRYYAQQARQRLVREELRGPTGERNELFYEGRGIFACVSPWNFPLAIFLGQISAALVAGNTVLAKPAEQTSLIAARTVELTSVRRCARRSGWSARPAWPTSAALIWPRTTAS